MRVIVALILVLLVVNLGVYLLPKSPTAPAHVYNQQEDLHPDLLSLLSEGDAVSATTAVTKAQCYRVGPFVNQAPVRLAKALLLNAGVEFNEEVREARRAEVYRVYVGPLLNKLQVARVRDELRDNGVLDHFAKSRADGQFIVSLGVYMKQASAESSLSSFVERGVTAEIAQETTLLPESYWLNLQLDEQRDALFDDLSNMDWGEYSAQLVTFPCS